MIKLPQYPTGRPVWVDPHKVSAVLDLLDAKPPRIQGGEPSLSIVGTTVVVDGASLQIAGHAEEHAEMILLARRSINILAN